MSQEIGETPAYLRADLTFHESIGMSSFYCLRTTAAHRFECSLEVAAVWTVFTVSNLNQAADSSEESSTIKLPNEGIIVRFELFEGPSGYGIR
jgi:hypothetical protein